MALKNPYWTVVTRHSCLHPWLCKWSPLPFSFRSSQHFPEAMCQLDRIPQGWSGGMADPQVKIPDPHTLLLYKGISTVGKPSQDDIFQETQLLKMVMA